MVLGIPLVPLLHAHHLSIKPPSTLSPKLYPPFSFRFSSPSMHLIFFLLLSEKYPLFLLKHPSLIPPSYPTSFQLFHSPNPINFHLYSTHGFWHSTSYNPIPLLQPLPINSLPVVYHLPSQFPKTMHWIINISMFYSACVCDKPQNELPCSNINPVSAVFYYQFTLWAVNQLPWVWTLSVSSSVSFAPTSPSSAISTPLFFSQFFFHSRTPNPMLSLSALPTCVPVHAITILF